MRAVVFHGVGDIRLEEVAEPTIREPTDAVVRIARSAICGTDLHFVRGTFPGVRPGTVLGHEAVGVVEEVGRNVRNLEEGDRPIGQAMNRNLSVKMGNCNHRKYIPLLLERVRTGAIDPSRIVTQDRPLDSVLDACEEFDRREPGWLKVELRPAH